MTQDREFHRPVMAGEVAALFEPVPPGVVVDATFGGGGHAEELLRVLGSQHRVLGIDRDPVAVERAERRGGRLQVIHGNFADLAELLRSVEVETPVGVLFDFGVSSRQIDDPARGFSFRHRGPLDMRMDPGIGLTAHNIVNEMPMVDLARLIRKYGEEPAADRIAAAIVRARPLTDTVSLAEVIGAAVLGPRRRGHPARRTFQALRIAVNDELVAIEAGLDQALDLLAVDGRCVTIAYHSLEDRLVKQKFATASAGCVCPPELPICGCGASPQFRLLTRGAGRPNPDEVASNPRARSARLRAVARVAA
jgi:16S rRNA (cytosine1402-N4)-methyltransferase